MTDVYTMLVSELFDQSRATVYYFPGSSQDQFTPEIIRIKDAYLSTNKYNFVLVLVAKNLYTLAVSRKTLLKYFETIFFSSK